MTSTRALLMVSGGIAAYKACFLARLLLQAGFSVKVAMTEAATRFVTPITFEALTGHSVATDLWGEGQSEALDHIEYARWADIAIVAPATANTMAKATHGIADDIVSTLLLAFGGPVLMAPAMNDNMWRHPATQANLQTLHDRGVATVGPGDGWLACGTISEGRMSEPEDILAAALEMAGSLKGLRPDQHPRQEPSSIQSGFWTGKKVLVTAGPTFETIDAVRFLGNRSTGAMGFALASALIQSGAQVHLVAGPTAMLPPRGLVQTDRIQSACEMADAVATGLQAGCDWLFMSAAVADFAPKEIVDGKIKKESMQGHWSLDLQGNPDILAEVVPVHRTDETKVVGFALETEDVLNRAASKRQAKNMDYIVANNPTAEGAGFGGVNHQVTLLGSDGVVWQSDSVAKSKLAWGILNNLADNEKDTEYDPRG
ncbi:MAG: bifunctional phosphopantothenoylcysteine decarboxylase/phosphopantothenate--cysteine ligase CoaBC [bacterium]|nr:bifunctional phosphopantothenoylcysteine decarboxylase/phosphopantothenate--cysteine ligase CoaBC [bacterium]